jgi:hypothetical protein
MVSTNAAVLPVPDCDCPIMFRGLDGGVNRCLVMERVLRTGFGEVGAKRVLGSLRVAEISLSRFL